MLKFQRSPRRFGIILYRSFVRLKYKYIYLLYLLKYLSWLSSSRLSGLAKHGQYSGSTPQHGISARSSALVIIHDQSSNRYYRCGVQSIGYLSLRPTPRIVVVATEVIALSKPFQSTMFGLVFSQRFWQPSPNHPFLVFSWIRKVLLLQSAMV